MATYNDINAGNKAVELLQTALASKAIDFGPMGAKSVDVAKAIASASGLYISSGRNFPRRRNCGGIAADAQVS